MKGLIQILASGAVVLALCWNVSAQVPERINYRGYLQDYPPEVTETLVFSLYDDLVSEVPIESITRTVTLFDGNFSVLLDLGPELFTESTRYLGVSLETGEELTRQQVISVPFALQAGNLISTPEGNVGIGTDSPSERLDVVGTIETNDLEVTEDAAVQGTLEVVGVVDAQGGIQFSDGIQTEVAAGDGHSLDAVDGSPTNALYVDEDGYTGVGTTNPNYQLHVAGDAYLSGAVGVGGSPRSDTEFYTYRFTGSVPPLAPGRPPGNWAGQFMNRDTGEDENGLAVSSSRSSSSAILLMVGYASSGTMGGSYYPRFQVFGDGDATLLGELTENSDARYKENVRTLSDCLESILKLRGISYEKKPEEPSEDPGKEAVGMVAQEVMEVLPEVVKKDSDGYYSIAYTRLVPVLVEAVKEQQRIIESQNAEIEDLRKKADALERLEQRVINLEASLSAID